MKAESADVVCVGAGIAGITCARDLAARGARVVVLERAAGVGGRCATRRVEGQPVDHGLIFLHGADPRFLAAVREVDDAQARSWPTRIDGRGLPCHPAAFTEGQCCIAFAEGLSAFPKHLARGLDIRLRTKVRSVEPEGTRWRAVAEDGAVFEGRHLVIALPVESVVALVAASPASAEVLRRIGGLLSLVGTVPCLTTIAGYPEQLPEPPWHVAYPEGCGVLQLISHDSSKRVDPRWRVLVLQARPGWSSTHRDSEPSTWSASMLEAAARRAGDWILRPSWVQAHRWRHARIDPGESLVAPLVVPCPPAGLLGVAGEAFDAAGGAEGAFLSGLALARALGAEA